MAAYRCGTCGMQHDELLMDMSYQRPADYFKIPEDERIKRIWMNAEANTDVCVIDNNEFYVRGILALPLRDSQKEFRWGVWARIEVQDFKHYLELWETDDVAGEPPFRGLLSGGVRDYAGSDTLEVTVHLQQNGQRPRFFVVSEEHPLGIAQRVGITMDEVHAFVEHGSSAI
jgi:hypothetical protein